MGLRLFLWERPCCLTWQSHAGPTQSAAVGSLAVRAPLRTNPVLAEMGTRPVWLLFARNHQLLGMNYYLKNGRGE